MSFMSSNVSTFKTRFSFQDENGGVFEKSDHCAAVFRNKMNDRRQLSKLFWSKKSFKMASPKFSRLVVVVVVAAISTLTSGQLLAAPAAAAAKAADGLSSESKQLECSLFNKKSTSALAILAAWKVSPDSSRCDGSKVFLVRAKKFLCKKLSHDHHEVSNWGLQGRKKVLVTSLSTLG